LFCRHRVKQMDMTQTHTSFDLRELILSQRLWTNGHVLSTSFATGCCTFCLHGSTSTCSSSCSVMASNSKFVFLGTCFDQQHVPIWFGNILCLFCRIFSWVFLCISGFFNCKASCLPANSFKDVFVRWHTINITHIINITRIFRVHLNMFLYRIFNHHSGEKQTWRRLEIVLSRRITRAFFARGLASKPLRVFVEARTLSFVAPLWRTRFLIATNTGRAHFRIRHMQVGSIYEVLRGWSERRACASVQRSMGSVPV
jgi:hypothetical protein